MRFVIYWVIVIASALEATIEKAINGESTMYWVLICGSFFFWLCAYGSIISDMEEP